MKPLVDLLLGPVGLAPATASPALLRSRLREAAGPAGILEEVRADGDPREPASIHALFASPGAPWRRATLLFLHGKGGCGAEWRPDAVRALRLGYNVLVPDLRGHPPSSGSRITYGLLERGDLTRLTAEVGRRHGLDPFRLGVEGCSMGSLVALHLAAEAAPAALWLQSPFAGLPEMAVQYVHRATGLPRWAAALPTALAVREIERSTGLSLSDLDPLAAARRVTCPTVIVHGASDELVPVRFVPELYAALGGEKELWIVPRCGHCHHPDEPQALHRAEYLERWTRFFLGRLPPLTTVRTRRARAPR